MAKQKQRTRRTIVRSPQPTKVKPLKRGIPLHLLNAPANRFEATIRARLVSFVIVPLNNKRHDPITRALMTIGVEMNVPQIGQPKLETTFYLYGKGQASHIIKYSKAGDMLEADRALWLYYCPPEMECDERRSGWVANHLRNLSVDKTKRWDTDGAVDRSYRAYDEPESEEVKATGLEDLL